MRMWRLRGGPAASHTSVISACWMSVCLAAPRDLRCFRPLWHPAPVVAWLQGGVSAVGSRAFPFVRFGRWPVCVPASPAAFTQLGNPDVCLPAGSVSPQPCGLFLGSSGFGRLPESLAKYRQQLSGYSAVRLPRRPGHLASRRRVGARHSVSPSGSLTLRLRKNRAVSLFLRRWKLRVVVPGGCLAIWVFDSSKPARSWAVGFPSSAPIRVPDALPPGGVPSSLPSGSPPVLSLLLAALVPSSWRPHSSLRRFSEAC